MKEKSESPGQIFLLEQRISVLEAQLKEGSEETHRYREGMSQIREARDIAVASEKETRKQFSDLKERLSNAEMENNRLRGYVQRVQEDDMVREELVQIGDPDGERRLVPKRHSTLFGEPAVVSDLKDRSGGSLYSQGYADRDYKPKHWITY